MPSSCLQFNEDGAELRPHLEPPFLVVEWRASLATRNVVVHAGMSDEHGVGSSDNNSSIYRDLPHPSTFKDPNRSNHPAYALENIVRVVSVTQYGLRNMYLPSP